MLPTKTVIIVVFNPMVGDLDNISLKCKYELFLKFDLLFDVCLLCLTLWFQVTKCTSGKCVLILQLVVLSRSAIVVWSKFLWLFCGVAFRFLIFCLYRGFRTESYIPSSPNSHVLYSVIMYMRLIVGHLRTSIYDKRDDFYFHITNFPFLSSNIPSSPDYGVFIS